jgi:archaellum component FlaF (FlaF/FlaG flagellin family)
MLIMMTVAFMFAAPVSTAAGNASTAKAAIDQARDAANGSRINNAYVQVGNQRLTDYNSLLSKEDAQIANLGSKGFDVSGLQAVENGARSSVVAPLQAAVNTGDGATIKAQLKSTSLDNAMPYSYHYSAKINLERLTTVNNKLLTLVNNSTIRGQLSDVSSKLSAVRSQLDAIGTSPYTGSQKDDVWNGLKAASQEMKTAIQEINANHNNG